MDQGNNGLSRGTATVTPGWRRCGRCCRVITRSWASIWPSRGRRLSWPIMIRGYWRGGGPGARRGSWVSCWTGRCARRWRRDFRGSRWRASRPGTGGW